MDLKEIRQQINDIDEQMVALFKKRMETVASVAKYKQENHMPVLDRTRERQVLCRVAEMAGEELEHYARALYTTLFDVSRNYQRNFLNAGSALAGALAGGVYEGMGVSALYAIWILAAAMAALLILAAGKKSAAYWKTRS